MFDGIGGSVYRDWGRGNIAIAIRACLWAAIGIAVRRLRSAKGHGLRARSSTSLFFLLSPTIPIQPDAVVAGFALSLAVGAGRFLFSTSTRMSASSQSCPGDEEVPFDLSRLARPVAKDVSECPGNFEVVSTDQHPFLERFLTSFPSCSGFFGRGMAMVESVTASDGGTATSAFVS